MGRPRRRSGREGERARLALAPLVTPLLCVAGVALLALRGVRELDREADDQGFGWIEPATLAALALPEWADPRWESALARAVSDLAPFSAADPAGLAEVRRRLAGLSFVEEVARLEVSWPDQLEVELRLRVPVACVPVGRAYLTVAADGTLLTGAWSVPPQVAGRWLPVLGSPEDAALFAHARPGDYLTEADHVAALDVALSMRLHLDAGESALLGRVRIDGSGSVAEDGGLASGGVRLLLEGGRECLFGRPPYADAPGELPAPTKWRSLVAALDLEKDPARAWSLVDLRWDRPELVPLHPELLAAAGDELRGGPEAPPARPERRRDAEPAAAPQGTGLPSPSPRGRVL